MSRISIGSISRFVSWAGRERGWNCGPPSKHGSPWDILHHAGATSEKWKHLCNICESFCKIEISKMHFLHRFYFCNSFVEYAGGDSVKSLSPVLTTAHWLISKTKSSWVWPRFSECWYCWSGTGARVASHCSWWSVNTEQSVCGGIIGNDHQGSSTESINRDARQAGTRDASPRRKTRGRRSASANQ